MIRRPGTPVSGPTAGEPVELMGPLYVSASGGCPLTGWRPAPKIPPEDSGRMPPHWVKGHHVDPTPVKHVDLWQDMQRAMSKQAEAERDDGR